jgi:hypothetical protein
MSILGRGGVGFISQKVGLVRFYKLSVLIMAASYLLWLPFNGYGWLVAFAATLGLGYKHYSQDRLYGCALAATQASTTTSRCMDTGIPCCPG